MIVVVRHGRTAANAGGMLLGRADPPLDAEGDRQVAGLARACADLDVARVVTSPLGRCRTTAGAIAAAVGGMPVEVDDRWIELDYGDLDGLPLAELPASLWSAWRSDPGWAPPGGESLTALGVGDEVAWRMWVAPASITRIGCAAPFPSLRSYNETAHLS